MCKIVALLLIVWFLLNGPDTLYAQTTDTSEYGAAQVAESIGFSALYDLAFEYLDRENECALDYIKRAEAVAWADGDSLRIVKSKRVTAQILSRIDQLTESVSVGEQGHQIARRNGFTREHCMILNNLATSYSFLGREDRALQYFFESYDFAIALNDSAFVTQALHNIGILYFRLRDFPKALDYLLRALQIGTEIVCKFGRLREC